MKIHTPKMTFLECVNFSLRSLLCLLSLINHSISEHICVSNIILGVSEFLIRQLSSDFLSNLSAFSISVELLIIKFAVIVNSVNCSVLSTLSKFPLTSHENDCQSSFDALASAR